MGGEASETFDCLGSACSVHVMGDTPARSAARAAALARRRLLQWHERFSRFLPASELTRLNRDPRAVVPASALMVRLASAIHRAGALTAGLVDGTLLDEVQAGGYAAELPPSLPLWRSLELAPPRRRAAAAPARRWRQVAADPLAGTITRPPGVMLDGGGLAKGLFADVLAAVFAEHASFAINCGGDLAVGGGAGAARAVDVESPFDARTLHTFHVRAAGVATSGIGGRSWLDADGSPAHHLLDPATGRAAFTGVVQVTALAPSALLAEIRAKAAILSGPREAPRWLAHGGVIVFDDGSYRVVEPPPAVTVAELAARLSAADPRASRAAAP